MAKPVDFLIYTLSPEIYVPVMPLSVAWVLGFVDEPFDVLVVVNVVDVPEFCTFYFPAMITKGPLTVAISTSGNSPAAAALLRRRMEKVLPDRTEEILDWIGENRKEFRQLGIMKVVVGRAFDVGRPLTQEEISDIIEG